jgi:hypothetical protein
MKIHSFHLSNLLLTIKKCLAKQQQKENNLMLLKNYLNKLRNADHSNY